VTLQVREGAISRVSRILDASNMKTCQMSEVLDGPVNPSQSLHTVYVYWNVTLYPINYYVSVKTQDTL
jgi:hypothetical protein